MERKYKAFISYRHAELDSAVAKTLHTLIEQYRIPKALRTDGEKKLGIVFRDEEELSATNDLTDKIYTALDNSEHLVVICTKSTLQSPWVTKEVEHFLKNHDRDKAHIILADGEPMDVFPRPLTHAQREDGVEDVIEPMAVDVRAESIPAVKKRIKSQILRLFAAMLGCPYDALAMREQHRKRQRFAAVFAAILAVAIGFSTVLLVKNHQIDRKNAELDSANTALEAKNEELDKKNSELDQKNEELETKNAEVLLRESELLTSNSAEAYGEGDNYNAIASAALALPTDTDPRPYYAPAEAALLTALSPFDNEDKYVMRDTVLSQTTPVENFCIAKDGSRIATIDLYTVVSIFDTATGELLNSFQLNNNTVYYSFSNIHMHPCDAINGFVVFDGYTVAAISFDTCDIVWTHDSVLSVSDFLVISNDSGMVVYVTAYTPDKDLRTNYDLVFLSAETGEIITTSTFADGAASPDVSFSFVGTISPANYNGRFSQDNTAFVTSFFTRDADDVYHINYSVTDIASGTSRIFYSYELQGYYFADEVYFLFCDTENSVISIKKHPDSGCVLQAERIDINSGKLYWRMSVPKPTLFTGITPDTDYVFGFTSGEDGNTAYVILNDYIHSFDLVTGEFISSSKIGSTVVGACLVEGNFAYVTDSGHYSKGFLSSYGISDLGDSVDLGDTLSMRVWNGGPTDFDGTEEYPEAGYIATVSADDPNSVIIKRGSLIEDMFPPEIPAFSEDDLYYSDNHPFKLNGGALALGPYFQDSTYLYKIVDTETGELLRTFPLSTTFGIDNMLFTPDGSRIIHTDEFGNITVYNEDGSEDKLLETPYILYSYADSFVCDIHALSTAFISAGSGDVISAACTEEELIWWTNGENRRAVPLPEDLHWLYTGKSDATFLMDAASDGRIFISDFTDDDQYIDRFAVYSIPSGKWSYFDLGSINLCVGDLYFSRTSPSFALLDDGGTVHVFDKSCEEISAFHLNLPTNSVYQLELILNDTYIMIKTTDLQLLFYDVKTGELVYREDNVSLSMANLSAFHDSKNNRLYIATDSSSTLCAGLCIDIGSWTTLARINGLIYFDESSLEMYRIAYLPGTYHSGVLIQTMPPATELAALARDFLGI